MALVKLGSAQQPANGIVDTGSTNTLMPLEVAQKYGLAKDLVVLPPENRITIKGIGG